MTILFVLYAIAFIASWVFISKVNKKINDDSNNDLG